MNDRILSFLGICRRAGKLTIGADSAVESIAGGKAQLILYADDFSRNSLKPVLAQAERAGVTALKLNRSKDELSAALGRLCGVLAIEDKGFADKLRQMTEAEQTQGGE